MDAYEVRDFQIVNLPEWTRSAVFAVTAKSDRMPTVAQAREMIRSLLAERFQLKIRHETRNIPAYALTVGKQDVKLQSRSDGVPLAAHVALLTRMVDRPVLDETRLQGTWALTPLDWQGIRQSNQVTDGGGVSVFTEVEEKWGLKLEPRTHRADVVIVESVQRPTEN